MSGIDPTRREVIGPRIGWEIDEMIFLLAATVPLNARGEFLIKPFCAALQRLTAEHPDTREEG
jgi:hypothetical protein